MKIFLDTAKVEEIKKALDVWIIDGVTTNPTLIYKAGRRDVNNAIREICGLVHPRPVSAEVISQEWREIIEEAKDISRIAGNIVVKIPVTQDGIRAVKELNQPQGFWGRAIKTNATLVFTANQALLAAKAGADYVSPFIGRLEDAGRLGMELAREIVTILGNYHFQTEVIVASIRKPEHVKEAALLGAGIVTLPFQVWQEMFEDPLTEAGIKKFLDDWQKLQGVGHERT